MIEFAKQNPSDNYLFMHSKGSTKPNPWCRSQMNHFEDRGIKKEKKYNKDDKVVVVAGTPPNVEAATNLISVLKIGEL